MVCVLGFIGDCNTIAKNSVTDITNNLTNVDNTITTNIQQDCIATTSGGNTVDINNSAVFNLSANQKSTVHNVCALKSVFKNNVNSDLQDKVANGIAQITNSKGGVLAAPANSVNDIMTVTTNDKTINNAQVLNSIKRCINNLIVGNSIKITNSLVDGSSIDQTSDAFINCLADDANTTFIANNAKTDTTNTADQKATATGGDIVSSFFGGLSSLVGQYTNIFIALIVGLVLVCIVSSGVSAYFSFSDSPVATSGKDNIGNLTQQLLQQRLNPPNYSNFEFLGTPASRLPIPDLYK
jgi:hypothetical protein